MATTAEMLSDPAYIRQLKAIADQNAWNSMLKTGADLANQNPWTGLGQLLGTAIGLKWGRNEGEADYQRSINAFQEKKFQDAFNKNSSWINNATSAVSQLSQPQTPTNSQPINSWLFNPREVQNKFAQDNGYLATPSINDSLYQKMKNPYGLQTNYFPYNPAKTPPTTPVNPLLFNQDKVQENFSQGVNYTPPPNYDFNLNLKNYKYNPQSYNDLIQKNGRGLQNTFSQAFDKNPTVWSWENIYSGR